MNDLSATPDEMRDAFLASLDWWREAGVEEHVVDEPGGWLKAREEPAAAPDAVTQTAPPPPPAEPPRRGALSRFLNEGEKGTHPGDPGSWPDDLAKFRKWWMESDMLDPPGAFPRIPPRGEAHAKAMLLIDQPMEQDRDTLLSGPSGTLAGNMLRAMGFADGESYLTSALPRHNLRPDWGALAAAGYGTLLLHHIALVRPERVIVCGERVWSLLAHEMAQENGALTTIAIDSGTLPVFAIPDMQTLLRNPAKRAQTWHRWLDWNPSSP